MTSFKKFAWYGSTAVASLVMAIALLVSTAGTAQAATLTVTALDYLKGSSVPTTTAFATVAAVGTNQAIPNSGKIVITFPAGTTFGAAATTAASWTVDDTGVDAAEAPATAAVSGTTLTLTLDGSSTVAATEGFTVATAAAGLIKFGTTTGTLSVATQDAASAALDSGSATLTLTGVSVTASPTSIAADGVSTSTISVGAASASNAGADTVSVVTNQGTFTGGTAGGAGTVIASFVTAPTAGAPLTTVTGTSGTGAIATTATTLTLRAGSTAGSVTVTVYITPAGGGQAQIAGAGIVTLTAPTAVAPGLPASVSITPTTAVSVTTTSTSGNITATFVDANGNAPIAGGTVTVNTTMGVLANIAGLTSCTNQSCTGTLAANGVVTVTLTGGGVAGTATITFTTNGISGTKSVVIAGATDTLTAAVQSDADGAGTGTAFVAAATPGAATFAAGGGVRVSVDPKDSAGNRVPGVSPAVTVAPNTCATVGATTASTGAAAATTVLTAGSAPVGTVCTVTATVGTKTATTTFTIGAALATTSVLTVNAVDMAAVSTQNVTVDVKDASGNKIQDGTSVTLVVSAGAVASASVLTVNGTATFIYVSPGTAQSVNLTAVAGSVNASKAISVGGAVVTPPPAGGEGTFAAAPSFGTGNVGSAVFQGGTIEQLVAAVIDAGGTSVWVQDSNGIWRSYNTLATGSAAFVNNGFNTAFAAGFGVQAVFVVR